MKTTRSIAIQAALPAAATRLRQAGSPTPRLDAELLLAHVARSDRTWILAHPEALIDADAVDALVERRAAGEPIAYIRGFKEWHSLRIRTDARALIPRPETELLADSAIAEIEARLAAGPTVAWDVATGSGAVALVTALRFADELRAGRLTLIASDISADALALASENLDAHGVGRLVRLEEADLLAPAAAGRLPLPDIVTANLPYVASEEVDERHGSLGYEPRIGVDGGADGLVVLRRFLAELPDATAPGATAFLELGMDQVDAIRALGPPGASVQVVPDLAGLDRVVRLGMPD